MLSCGTALSGKSMVQGLVCFSCLILNLPIDLVILYISQMKGEMCLRFIFLHTTVWCQIKGEASQTELF